MPGQAGLFYALFGRMWDAVGRFEVLEYRNSHDGIKRRVEPVNGLYGGFVFLLVHCPAGHGRKKYRLRAIGGHISGGS